MKKDSLKKAFSSVKEFFFVCIVKCLFQYVAGDYTSVYTENLFIS